MIDPRDYAPLTSVTVVSVLLGIVTLLVALLVPREAALISHADAPDLAADAFNTLVAPEPPPIFAEDDLAEPPAAPAPRTPTFAGALTEASNRVSREVGSLDDLLEAPLVDLPKPERAGDRVPARRISWPVLVDETAIDVDLPTRLRLIEGLGLIGGSWSIEILARAYEQELDPNVRGAIFVALRDCRSAA